MKEQSVYLKHISDAAEKISQYIAGGKSDYLEKTYIQDAVIRQLEIIGEATKQLNEEFRIKYPEIPWKRMAGMRDVLIHDYMGVDVDTVWVVAHDLLPDIRKKIINIIASI